MKNKLAYGAYDEQSPITRYVIEIAKRFNQYSMSMVNEKEYTNCHNLLTNLLEILSKFKGFEIENLKALSLNNLSCCFKRNGQI